MSISRYRFSILFLFLLSLNLYSQKSSLKILLPQPISSAQQKYDITYIPEDGFNLYDNPNGKHIGRVKRDTKGNKYKNYLLNIFICPINRAPELFPLEALAPLKNNTYAIPVVKQTKGFVMLFDTAGPYHYWADVKELKKLGYEPVEWKSTKVDPITEDGAGILPPDFDKLKDLKREFTTYLPIGGVQLYNAPKGKKNAKLDRFCPVAKYSDGNMRMYILSDSNACLKHITTEHLYHLTDDTYAIPYYKKEMDFILLFNFSNTEYWANSRDFTAKDFKILSWKNYFIENKGTPCYANGDSLVLREGPYEDAKQIMTLNDDTTEIIITGYDGGICEGSWCKVTVTIYKENPCRGVIPESENVIKKIQGWIKLIHENGQPTIHINTKGC